jgi:hypothetical protein
MSLQALEYRPPQPRPPHRSLPLLLAVMATIGLMAIAIPLLDRKAPAQGTTQTTVISIVDAKTSKPIRITISGPTYPAADPWKRKIVFAPPNTIRIQWVNPKAPATILITSPGYQSLGISPGSGLPPIMTMGLSPVPPTPMPPAIPASSAARLPTAIK